MASRRREKWQNFEASCKAVKKKVKASSGIKSFLDNRTEPGEIYDDKKGIVIKLSEVKNASTLRRLLRTINNYYYLTKDEEQEYILNKKKELEDLIGESIEDEIETGGMEI